MEKRGIETSGKFMNRRELFAGLLAAPVALAGAAKAAQGSGSPLRAVLGTSEVTVDFPFVQTQEQARRMAKHRFASIAPVHEDLEWSVPFHGVAEAPWA